ncbi:MAG: hypothetical protein KDD55_06695 [Bdellovibrionales bacterium]|nr:hypothetical protein [Bdellovibrionales bacterium]
MTTKKNSLSREDAQELYRDLQKTMKSMKKPKKSSGLPGDVAKQMASAIRQAMAKDDAAKGSTAQREMASPMSEEGDSLHGGMSAFMMGRESGALPQGAGRLTAISFVIFFALAKLTFSAFEYSGVLSVEDASASMPMRVRPTSLHQTNYSKEEIRILTALDARREELQERSRKLDLREEDVSRKDREFAARLTELRDLTEKLKIARERNEKQRNNQIEQLSNVYGSMNPTEAAELIEQLDVTIALKLLERMPEKRIGQILSLMSPDRALTITRMLSGTK